MINHERRPAACCDEQPEQARGNPPGRDRIDYRIGTHASFFRKMIDELARVEIDGRRPLAALQTRSLDDHSIALIDAWAVACDVLSFYQERIANEGFLHTAVEARSLFEIAASLGYVPRPGVAASTHLALFVDDQPGAAPVVALAAALPIMSVPQPEADADPSGSSTPPAMPQTFETSAALDARPDWNTMRAWDREVHEVANGTTELYLDGVSTRVQIGDPVVVVGRERRSEDVTQDERWDLRQIVAVDLDDRGRFTKITLDHELGDRKAGSEPPAYHTSTAYEEVEIITFNARAALFGHNAADPRIMPADMRTDMVGTGLLVESPLRWKGWSLEEDPATAAKAFDLAGEHDGIMIGGWICLAGRDTKRRQQVELYKVRRTTSVDREAFGLAARCTRVYVDASEHLSSFRRRATLVYCDSRSLPIGLAPNDDMVAGKTIVLDRVVTPLAKDHELLARGQRADGGGPAAELLRVASSTLSADGLRTEIELVAELQEHYLRSSFELLGNVVEATHGSSVGEVVGSGNAATPHQRFVLRQAPLTWTSASNELGAEASLELRVDDIAWQRVDRLYPYGPKDRVYTLRTEDDGSTTIQFGDGTRGARLPSGLENLVARYRKGIGVEGEVPAESLVLLQRRPLGLRGVVNPMAARGAEDPETQEVLRQNLPLTVLTLDRLVSLQDYEDFARAFAGVGKAGAFELWDGHRTRLHVVVAGSSGALLPATSATVRDLMDAFVASGDPTQVVSAGPHVARSFYVQLGLVLEPGYASEFVEPEVVAALTTAFGFQARGFGQGVRGAEILEVAQSVRGVRAVDLDWLDPDTPTTAAPLGANPFIEIPAKRARLSDSGIIGAELWLLDASGITIAWRDEGGSNGG